MLVGTTLGIFFIPLFFVVVERVFVQRKAAHPPAEAGPRMAQVRMNRRVNAAIALAAALSASSCAMLEPKLPTAQPSIWASGPARNHDCNTGEPLRRGRRLDIGWREFFADPKLEELIGRALANNRDLRVAVLNVERARAQYHVQRADRVPSLGVNGTMVRSGGDALRTTEAFSVGLGVTEFELDLFGRVRNLSQSALETYFSQEEARSAQLSLIAEVANAYLTLAADREQLRLALATLQTREQSHALTEKRHELGAISALDVSQSRTQVEASVPMRRATRARWRRTPTPLSCS